MFSEVFELQEMGKNVCIVFKTAQTKIDGEKLKATHYLIHIQDRDHDGPYLVNWINDTYSKIITNSTKLRLLDFFQISQVSLLIASTGSKMIHYGGTTFSFPSYCKYHFIKPSLLGESLNKYMKKVDIEVYLSHEGCNRLVKLIRKWDPNYLEIIFDSISDDNLFNL